MKIKKIVLLMCVFAFVGIACSKLNKNLDVVGQASIISFGEILKLMPDNVLSDDKNFAWDLVSPDKSVRFIWSKDYSKSVLFDVMLEFDAQPFIDAGLDIDKLPKGFAFYDGKIVIGQKLGNDEFKYKGEVTPLSSYEQIVNLYRDIIGYHSSLDHYGITIGNGNLFEWAKDVNTNDKDIVFVLNPEPFISAGVNPNRLRGWVFAKVLVDIDGKAVEVDKFLKPFNLK